MKFLHALSLAALAGALCCEAKTEAKTKSEAKPVATYRFTEALKHFMELPIEEEGADAKRTVKFQTRKTDTTATLYENNKEELVQAEEGDVVALYKWDRIRFAKAELDMVGSAVFEKRDQFKPIRNENGVFNLALNDKDLVVVTRKQDSEREGYEFYEFEFNGNKCSCEITPDIVVSQSEDNIAPVPKEGLLDFFKIFWMELFELTSDSDIDAPIQKPKVKNYKKITCMNKDTKDLIMQAKKAEPRTRIIHGRVVKVESEGRVIELYEAAKTDAEFFLWVLVAMILDI